MLELLIFSAQSFQFGLQIFVGHARELQPLARPLGAMTASDVALVQIGTIVATDGSVIVGTITLATTEATRGSPFYDRPDVASVGQFAVDPSRQSRGIGRALLTLAEQRAEELGVGYLAPDTSEHAARLIALYERWGFRFVEYSRWSIVNYCSVVTAKYLKST